MKPSLFLRAAGLLLALGVALPLPAADKVDRASGPSVDAKTAPRGKVDINTAEPAALEALPEIGTDLANAVIAARPFKSVEDLQRVSGIGPGKMNTLRGKVTASPVQQTAGTKPDGYSSSGPSKVSPLNNGKATERKAVSEPYDRTVAQKSAEQKSNRTAEHANGSTPVPRAGEDADRHPAAGEPTGRTDRARDASGRFISDAAAATRIDVNTATREQLESLPEIGPVKAQAIMDARPFSSLEDLKRVNGIKDATFDAIKELVVVEHPARR